jgi:hypothetical protein
MNIPFCIDATACRSKTGASSSGARPSNSSTVGISSTNTRYYPHFE